MKKLFMLFPLRVAVAHIMCATALLTSCPAVIYASDPAVAYYIPTNPRDKVWWKNDAEAYAEKHPGLYFIGVSKLEKNESEAKAGARRNAEKETSVYGFFNLTPIDSVTYHEKPFGKQQVWQLFVVKESIKKPGWVIDFDGWKKEHLGDWVPPTSGTGKTIAKAFKVAYNEAKESIENDKGFALGGLSDKYVEGLPDSQVRVYLLYGKIQSRKEYGYLDIFGGQGVPKMSLEFANSNKTIYLNQLGLSGPVNGPYKSVKWNSLQTTGYGPVGVRFGGYGNGHVGGALELGMEKRYIKRQTTHISLDDAQKNFNFVTGDYLSVTSFYLIGNLMFRPWKGNIEPYVGVGGGISLNPIHMPHVAGLKDSSSILLSAPTDNLGSGFVFNIPVGVRVRMGTTQVVAEMRYQANRINFDRGGINGESDSMVIKGYYFNIGIGFNFGSASKSFGQQKGLTPQRIAPGTRKVYAWNKEMYTVNIFGVEDGKSWLIHRLSSGEIWSVDYSQSKYNSANLQGELYNGQGQVVSTTRIEHFTNGTWVWILEGNRSITTRDISILPQRE